MTTDFEKQALGASVIELTQQIIGLRARVFELQAELAQAKAPPANGDAEANERAALVAEFATKRAKRLDRSAPAEATDGA